MLISGNTCTKGDLATLEPRHLKRGDGRRQQEAKGPGALFQTEVKDEREAGARRGRGHVSVDLAPRVQDVCELPEAYSWDVAGAYNCWEREARGAGGRGRRRDEMELGQAEGKL